MVIWYIVWSFGTFSRRGMSYQEKSGNPALARETLFLKKDGWI
jgi:hypothetical protein